MGNFSLDDFINEWFLPKMTSSMGAIYLRWLHQWLISTKDDIINGWFLPKMTSSMGDFYLRWLHQWVLSTYDDFINGWFLPKITLSLGDFYLRWLDPFGHLKMLCMSILSLSGGVWAWMESLQLTAQHWENASVLVWIKLCPWDNSCSMHHNVCHSNCTSCP